MVRPVLIIEDDSDIAESLQYNLEREGLSVVVALTGEQGLVDALNQRNPPSLIILDLMLPGMSGIELQEYLTAHGYNTPVVFITAFPDQGIRDRAMNGGAVGFLSKPFDESRLLQCVEQALARRQSRPDDT